MLTKEEKRKLRSTIFRHLDGIAIAPTMYALHKKGVLSHLLDQENHSLSELVVAFKANEGYLNVALRLLCSQGWLKQKLNNESDEISYSTTAQSSHAFSLAYLYKDVADLLTFSAKFPKRKFHPEPFQKLKGIMNSYQDQYGLGDISDDGIAQQILKHIEGILVGPTIVQLGMGGMFHKYFMETSFSADEFHEDGDSFSQLLDFFVWLGWFEKNGTHFRFTEKGLFYAKRASAYGVTVSYIPTFRQLDKLIFGDPYSWKNVKAGETEKHVDREMNVWGSGGAHASYFKKMDEVIIKIFNQPIEQQPKGILDLGCGNGAFLIHAFETIEQRTLRGQMLEDHPLFLVGADFNIAALKVSRANLIQSDVWAKLIWADIGKPKQLADDLNQSFNIALSELLNVRTFLDHNRIWSDVTDNSNMSISNSTGAFAHRGKRISNNEVEQNLMEHFNKWIPYVKKHGLLLIELHTVDPNLVAVNIGNTAATAYDATHGYSDQYIVELDVFKQVAERTGLIADPLFETKFPNSDLATVSINLFRGK